MQRGDTPLHVAAKLYLRLFAALHKLRPLPNWDFMIHQLSGPSEVIPPNTGTRFERGAPPQSMDAAVLMIQMYNCFSVMLRACPSAAGIVNQVHTCAGIDALLNWLFPLSDVPFPVQAGYLPFHFLVCNPLCPSAVLQAVVACYPRPCRMEFAAKRLFAEEMADCLQAPHHFELIRLSNAEKFANRYNIARHFRDGYEDVHFRIPGGHMDVQYDDGDIVTVVVTPSVKEPEWTLPLVIVSWARDLDAANVLLMAGADPHHIQVRCCEGVRELSAEARDPQGTRVCAAVLAARQP